MTEKPKVRFITLGCRVNQYETQGMREALQSAGFDFFSPTAADQRAAAADVVIINTCTVTGEADRESRYWIRRARREHPEARIVVTGCGVERDYEAVRKMSEVDDLVFNHEKPEIGRYLSAARQHSACGDHFDARKSNRARQFSSLSITCSEGKTRAVVKIQDGCNHACSFCRVVLVRGRSRSRDAEEVVEEVKNLRDRGYREIVFAGIQLGAYGLDAGRDGRAGFSSLLEKCAGIAGIDRLRLSSIEPMDVTSELMMTLRDVPKCMPHLHIPLQSGDDTVLRRMNRRYDSRFYGDLIERLRSEVPDFNLTMDVIAGFPGEDDGCFENTVRLLEKVRPLKCHIFPFSRREGTRAAGFCDGVSPAVVRERIRFLSAWEKKQGLEVMKSYTGREFPVLVEGMKKQNGPGGKVLPAHCPDGEKPLTGHTPNFMKVTFRGKEAWSGKVVRVRLTDAGPSGLSGVPLAGEEPIR
jgi:threonylcarbamoyladenosine tRNA methylthiotransferase MtaB